ncbi:protein FAR1-RELATED SEQUENCE 4-like [Carya illinoinensis]|uniref:protein FAR1-RELATED SEQUENCE 4-like n=1 Tax=Carya illinoinensis TaxID=32201 RepID=UPI001C71968F|nr:protein FAR1-RELATED SEQUENCE 4-like [Carya illinoinensis]
MSKSFNPLVEGEGVENLSSAEKDHPNFIDEERYLQLGKGGGAALCKFLQRMQGMSNGFYSVINFNPDNRLRKYQLFFLGISRAAYKSFWDVVTFDITYLTNRHKIPIVVFMGVNHHGQSIFFGAGLISSQDAYTFVWLFQIFLECMNGQTLSAIVTDQDKAIKSAVAIVFPRIRYRFCLWRIMRKLPEKLGSHAQYTCGLKSVIQNCLYDSQTCDEFEKSWQMLLDIYNLHDNAWLRGLYSEWTYWVPAYLKDIFWARMSITRKSENVNTYFDGFLHSKTTVKDFFDQFDSILRRKIDNEDKADFNSFNSMISCISPSLIKKKFQEMYTIAKFKEVQQEFVGMISCNCS